MQIASIDPVQLVQQYQERGDMCQVASEEFAAGCRPGQH